MLFSKVISKSAAVVAAMAMMLPVVGVATPAFSNAGNAIVASAAEDWNVATISEDQYVKVGSTFSFKVECREWVSNASYEWQISTYGKGMSSSSWTKIGSNKDTLTGTMTSDYNGAHIRCKVTNNDNGVVDYSPVRTISSNAASAKLGTAAKQSDGSYKIPLTISGLKDSSIATFCPKFVVDSTKVSKVTFSYDSSFNKGDDFGEGFYQLSDGTSTVDGEYTLEFATILTPGKVGSSKTVGYLYVTPKSGVSTLKVDMKALEDNSASLYGDNYEGTLVYGMSYSGTTIGGSGESTSKTRYPVPTVQVNGNAVKISWTKADNASKYGVGMYVNGSWRAQVQVDNKTTYITKKGLKKGTYKMVVLAKVNGEWDRQAINQRAFTFTIK